MSETLIFWSWEARPAVSTSDMANGEAWAVLTPDGGWTPVSIWEVWDSGRAAPDEATWRAAFSKTSFRGNEAINSEITLAKLRST